MDTGELKLPCVVACPHCGADYDLARFKICQCTSCGMLFFVDRKGGRLPVGECGGESPEGELILDLTLKTEFLLLMAASTFVGDILRSQGVDQEASLDLEIACDEALQNIAEHGYKGEKGRAVRIWLVRLGRQIRLAISDQGQSFDPSAQAETSVEAYAESGLKRNLGIHVMRNCIDALTYKTDDLGNTLIMTKSLGGQQG